MKECIVWADNFSFWSAINLFCDSRQSSYKILEVRYFGKMSFGGRWAARYFLKTPIKERTCFDMSLPDPVDGEALFWHVWRDSANFGWQTAQESQATDFLLKDIPGSYNPATLQLFIKRQIAYDQKRNIGIIRLAHYYKQQEKVNSSDHMVWVENNPWKVSLGSYAKQYQISLKGTGGSSGIGVIRWLYLIAKIAEAALINFSLSWKSPHPDAPRDEHRAKIAVFYAQGFDLEKRSDIYWWKDSGIDPKDVIVYFMDPSKPPTKERVDVLQKSGFHWFSFFPRYANREDIANVRRFYQALIKNLWSAFIVAGKLLWKIPGQCSDIKAWQFERLSWLLTRIALFEAFFRTYFVRVQFGLFSEDDQNIMAVNLAMERSQGVDVYAHWSNHPEAQIMPAHDIYFSWGPYFRPMYEKIGHGIKNLLYCGYPFSGLDVSAKSKNHRRKLESAGAKFVLSFFDNAYVEGQYFSKESIVEFYQVLLEKVLVHKDWGIIIKPKREDTLKDVAGEEISSLITKLQQQGRCLVLNQQESPSEAALASDLIIGYGVFSTPNIESSLAGIPAITYDPSYQHSHPFYRQGFEKIVFHQLGKLIARIEEYSLHPSREGGFADYSFILSEMDPFQDRKAYVRIGTYMKVLLDEFSAGRDRMAAIQQANTFYKREYGDDKVVDLGNRVPVPSQEKITV